MRRSLGLVALVLVAAFGLQGGTIGNWDGSTRTWNNANMSIMKATAEGAGHTVRADAAITSGELASSSVFLIGEPGAAPTAGEVALLNAWVNGGGILLVMFDSSCAGCTGNNPLLSSLGTGMSGSGSASGTVFAGGNFASMGPPYDIVGQSLITSPGTAIVGGTSLAGSFIQYSQLGSGWVFAFADRSDHNFANPNAGNTNGQLFLNILDGGAVVGVPEPTTLISVGIGLVGLAGLSLRRRRA